MRPINCVIVSKHWLQRNWFEHVMLYFVWCFSYRWGADTGWIFHGSKPQWSFAIGNQPSSACDCSCLSERWPLEILSVNARNWCVISTVVCSEVNNNCQLIWFFGKSYAECLPFQHSLSSTIVSWMLRELLWSPYVIGQTIIYLPCGFYLSSSCFFIFSPNLSGRRVDVYHTSAPGVGLVWI